jgi:AcrR family transcriptional regulator
MPARQPLDRDRVVSAAVALADEAGLSAVTMRALGQRLGVEAMSLYHHVSGKDELLAAMVEVVTGEVERPRPGRAWDRELRRTALSLHQVLLRHPWAGSILEGRASAGPVRLGYLEAVMATLRSAGFDIQQAYRASRLVDTYVYGSALLESSSEVEGDAVPDAASAALATLGPEYPHLRELAEHIARSRYSEQTEFTRGLDVLVGAIRSMHG